MSIAVLYSWRVKSGMETQFRAGWVSGTRAIHRRCGSYGARLHRAADGTFWSYARWPDDASRKACFAAGAVFQDPGFARMQAAVAESFDEVVLDLTDDLLAEPEREPEGG